MMHKTMLVAIVALAAGCAHAVETEPTELQDEAALAAAGVPRGLYFLEGATPRKDAVLGLRLDASGKGDLLWSYMGDSRIEQSCVVKAKVLGSRNDKKLELRCPADTLTFGLVKNEGDLVELTNPTGETFSLRKVDPDFRGDKRFDCKAEEFSARIDVVGGASGSQRRALVTIKLADVDHNMGTPLAETFWVSGSSKLEGLDIKMNEYDLALPSNLTVARFEATLGFLNTFTPFTPHRVAHALECTAAR